MINKTQLQNMLDSGNIIRQKHPTETLWIYNYTAVTQYERVWNEVTLQCRGLILDEQYQVVARPFPKFFNLGETDNQVIPKETFEVYEKMDGSLGILYWWNDQPFIATRGSFASEQSKVANELLHTTYADAIAKLDSTKTYLFEIIYPSNRIVVDYGEKEALVLLAIVDTATGKDAPLENIGFPVVKKYDGLKDIYQLQTLAEDNKEGFVIKFQSGLRYKVKFEEYVRIHKIITQVSSISIWEYLSTGQSLNEILEQVPDEFYQWVRQKQATFQMEYAAIEQQCQQDFKVLATRKETAAYFQTCSYPAVLFKMLDGKSYEPVIWKMLRPVFEKPFVGKRQRLGIKN